MPDMTSCLRLHATGNPADVRCESLSVEAPAAGQVLIRISHAPVNPADINILEGTYGIKPELPAFIGNEGVGKIEAVGSGVDHLRVGQWVLPPNGCGTWRQQLLAAAEECTPLPDGLDPRQAAMLQVNPATAWRMLHDFVELKPGDWIAQNAANSAVGRSVIQIARAKGWRTLNLVRRPELIQPLKEIGADVVLSEDGADVRKEIMSASGGQPVRLALNAVGGESASLLCRSLSPGAIMATYGAMSKQPLKIANSALIFQDISFRGFWMTRWNRAASAKDRDQLFADLAALSASGALRIPVEKEFPLKQYEEAIAAARGDRRAGKIIFRCD